MNWKAKNLPLQPVVEVTPQSNSVIAPYLLRLGAIFQGEEKIGMTKAKAALAKSLDWQEALNEVLAELASFGEIDRIKRS